MPTEEKSLEQRIILFGIVIDETLKKQVYYCQGVNKNGELYGDIFESTIELYTITGKKYDNSWMIYKLRNI